MDKRIVNRILKAARGCEGAADDLSVATVSSDDRLNAIAQLEIVRRVITETIEELRSVTN